MSDEQIGNNYASIGHNLSSIQALGHIVDMLTERVTKLETAIVQLCNEEEPDVDWAEIAQQRKDNEDGYTDR